MERLTEFHDGIWGLSVKATEQGCDRYTALSRLAKYEDTGLSPEQVRELQEQKEVLLDTVNMLSPLMMENRKLKEKQTPKKVTETYEIATNYARGRYGVCPNCGQDAITYNCDKYCWNCSQKLDWEGR